MIIDFKLACDNQISKKATKELRDAGFEVVYSAGNEQDEVWIENALLAGATVFVSPDLDIPNYLDRMNVDAAWIDVSRGISSHMQAGFIIRQLMRLVKNQLAGQPDYKLLQIGRRKYLVRTDLIDAFLRATTKEEREKESLCVMSGNSVSWSKNER